MEPPTPSRPAASESEPPDPRIGAVLQGRYRILSKIAAGAMGVVYQGERVQLGRPVAVKFLHPWIASQKTFLSRFENEARAMSRLGHPNCVSVIDFGVEGSPYLVMDFVTGQTLRQAVQGPQPPARALHIARQLLAGLGHAHAQGIVHRDLKPDNLILTDEEGLDDHLRILDFGLAKLRDGPAMTAGMAVGTPSYMSPEQTGAAGNVDARSDLYAVGVLLFELLAGRKPFESAQIGELILMHREAAPPSLRALVPGAGISAALEAVVAKLLAKRQEDRYQSTAELAAALDATPEGMRGAPAAPPVSPASVAPAPSAPTPALAAAPAAPAPAQPPVAPAVRAGALPLPPATGRPPRSPEATVVDTATAIMRRHDLVVTAGADNNPASPSAAGGESPGEPAGAAASPLAVAAGGRTWPDRRIIALAGGAAGCVLIAVLFGLVRHRAPEAGAPASSPAPVAMAATTPPPPAGPSSSSPTGAPAPTAAVAGGAAVAAGAAAPDGRVEEARRLRHNGEWEQALAVLARARRESPQDADVDYLLADIYLEHHRPLEGISSAQSAIRKNPALRSDGDLVNAVIDSLGSDKTYDRSQAFLRGLGSAATPFLKEAAHHHASAKVRQRAAEVLQSSGGGRSAFGSSAGSSSSLFHR